MKKFSYALHIEASSEAEAEIKKDALLILAAKLSAKELAKMAHVIERDPIKTALAKKYLGLQ